MTGLPADHPSVETVRAHLRRFGPGLRLLAPADAADLFPTAVVRVVIDGDTRYARPRTATDGTAYVAGVYDTPDLARDPSDATDRLAAWADAHGLGADDPVLVDVLSAGGRYGLREPGGDATYPQRRERSDSLADIARDLDG